MVAPSIVSSARHLVVPVRLPGANALDASGLGVELRKQISYVRWIGGDLDNCVGPIKQFFELGALWSFSDHDRSTAGLIDPLVPTPSGHVPLRMLAEIEQTDGPNQIQRENGRRRIAVYGNRDGQRDMRAIVSDIRSILAEMKPPQGYAMALEGTFQAQEQAMLRIGSLSLVSFGLIFVVLYSRYRSTVLALIIMASVPLALIGSVIALKIAGQPLSVASMGSAATGHAAGRTALPADVDFVGAYRHPFRSVARSCLPGIPLLDPARRFTRATGCPTRCP